MIPTADSTASICVDMGTTNTRLWLVQQGAIVDRFTEPLGLRDAARQRSSSIIRDRLASLLATASSRAATLGLRASHILAAGMLTSPLGLCEVPHVSAPAGERELAKALRQFSDPEVADLPIYLVPGVRTGPVSPSLQQLQDTDLMRGEETMIVGLLEAGLLSPNSTFLNLGSHWKAISIDDTGRIASSFTTLSGEFIHVLQTHTVLASALPQGRLEALDPEWLERGRRFERQNGTGRSMFAVRLLEQVFQIAPSALSSFLLGAVVESDLNSMDRLGILNGPIVVAGTGSASEAWCRILESTDRNPTLLSQDTLERCFVAGLIRLFRLSGYDMRNGATRPAHRNRQ